MAVRIVVPYTNVHPRTSKALERYGSRVEYREMKGEFDYWNLVTELWRDRWSFILIEHDVEPSSRAIQGLEQCAEPICMAPYPFRNPSAWDDAGNHAASLGCCRVSASLIAKFPQIGEPGHLWDVPAGRDSAYRDAVVYEVLTDYEPPYPWDIVGMVLKFALKSLGVLQHDHPEGQVTHHRAFEDIGCLCGEDCGTLPSSRDIGPNAQRIVEQAQREIQKLPEAQRAMLGA